MSFMPDFDWFYQKINVKYWQIFLCYGDFKVSHHMCNNKMCNQNILTWVLCSKHRAITIFLQISWDSKAADNSVMDIYSL